MISQFLFLVLTYFVSAIPFGLVLGKVFAQKDVREFGSKNIGATNVARVLGKKLGLATLLLDGLKGAIMLIIARFAFYDSSHLHLFLVLVAAVAVAAHIYPIYLQFKGGKGVATAIATIFALDPAVGFLMICFWILSFCLFRISSIASLLSIFSSIILSSVHDAPMSQMIFCSILFALILYRHKENLLRLMTGEEKKL
jgi:glycerol-3-phosphate acyltransferase PlsY